MLQPFRSVSIPDNYAGGGEVPGGHSGHLRAPDQDTLDLAKTYFDLKEYDRAAFFAKDLQSQAGEGVYFWDTDPNCFRLFVSESVRTYSVPPQ